jgi:hypothetical protein
MLTVRDHMTIRLAAAHYKFPAARETDALEQLGWTATIFWRHVNRLLDDPEALATYPLEVKRLRRLRDARRRLRAS